jgi:hypothetical protein
LLLLLLRQPASTPLPATPRSPAAEEAVTPPHRPTLPPTPRRPPTFYTQRPPESPSPTAAPDNPKNPNLDPWCRRCCPALIHLPVRWRRPRRHLASPTLSMASATAVGPPLRYGHRQLIFEHGRQDDVRKEELPLAGTGPIAHKWRSTTGRAVD